MSFLTLRVYDVDQNGAPTCVSDVDKVYVNDYYLGNLSGANNQWSNALFLIPADRLNPGLNYFEVAIDTLKTDYCWAVQVDWAELKFTQNIAQTEAWALDDVTIRRGKTNDYIGKGWFNSDAPIWKTTFDSSGNLILPANPDDPIADKISAIVGIPLLRTCCYLA